MYLNFFLLKIEPNSFCSIWFYLVQYTQGWGGRNSKDICAWKSLLYFREYQFTFVSIT